jgi:Sec1 family
MNLVEIVTERIVSKVLSRSNSRDEWRALVIHEPTARLLHHTMTVSDIFAHNIALIERLEQEREPQGEFTGIYFVRLEDSVLDKIIKEYKEKKYKEYYIISVNEPSEKQMKKIGALVSKSEVQREKGKEYVQVFHRTVLFDFVPQGSDLFQLECRNEYYLDGEEYTEEVSRKLYNMCRILKVEPVFYSVGSSSLRLSQKMEMCMDGEGGRGRDKFIVMERGHDVNSALMHFFTFESALWDYKLAGPGYVVYREGLNGRKEQEEERRRDGESEPSSSESLGESEDLDRKKMEVGDKDELWLGVRNSHLSETNDILSKHIREVTKKSEGIETGNIKNLSKAIHELPSQTRLIRELNIFVRLVEQCVEVFSSNNLKEVSLFEQGLSTGYTADKKRFKDIPEKFFRLMESPAVTKTDKFRLYLLLLANNAALDRRDVEKLLDFGYLKKREIDLGDVMKKRICGRQIRPARENELEISRYVSVIEDVLAAVIKEKESKYKHLKLKGPGKKEVPAKRSLRKKGFVFKSREQGSDVHRNVVIVYFIGGVSIAEITAIREVCRKMGTEVVIGSTDVYEAGGFIEMIKRIAKKQHAICE